MLKPENVPNGVIRKAMHIFNVQMDGEECSVGESWSIIIAAAINAWPGVKIDLGAQVTDSYCDPGKVILPITQDGRP